VAGIVFARLHELTGDPRWKQRGEELVRAFAGGARELGLYAATYLLAVDWHLSAATHLVIVGVASDSAVQAMHRAALSGFVPRRVIQLIDPAETRTAPLPPALSGMLAAGQAPRGYACAGASCSAPAEDLSSWTATLEGLRPVPSVAQLGLD
jgi:uncharacterized protein YyaL (SSP411 family)